ncbi:hypothetical protein ACVW1A_004092 [Bradyrhizobium sp. LB1.3]
MLSDSRNMVEISRTVGKAENSSGVWMNSDVIRIRIESVIEIARNRSSTIAGSGRISTTRMVRTPSASAMSPRLRMLPISARVGKPAFVLPAPCPAVTSTMVAASPRDCRPRAPNVCAAAEGPPFRK